MAQQSNLRVRKGEKYKIIKTIRQSTATELMGKSTEKKFETTTTTVYTIQEANSAGYQLESTLTRVITQATLKGQTEYYDSDVKTNAGSMPDTWAGWLNKPHFILLDRNGSLVGPSDSTFTAPATILGIASGPPQASELFIPELTRKKMETGQSYPSIREMNSGWYNVRDSGSYVVTAIKDGVTSIVYKGLQIVRMTMVQGDMEMLNHSRNIVTLELKMDSRTARILQKEVVVYSIMNTVTKGSMVPSILKWVTTTTITPIE